MTGNERRYLTRVERRANRADQCGTLYVVSFMCLTGAAAFLVLSFFVAALGWGWRFWR